MSKKIEPILDGYYAVSDVAKILKLCEGRVRLLDIDGRIKIAGRYFYPAEAVKAFAKIKRKPGRPPGYSPIKKR